jgi:Raf kinase inhibitor-like YbhB/YbcL family protein
MRAALAIAPVLAVVLAICGSAPAAAMSLTSADLKPDAPMPARDIHMRCGGQNVSPQLTWSGAPNGTKSYVLTMLDRDVAPNWWSHWIVVGLPASLTSLPAGLRTPLAPAAAVTSNFGDASYDGPCPPPGTGVHHYDITIWAMPTASVDIEKDTPANALAATLAQTSLDHATIEVTAQR